MAGTAHSSAKTPANVAVVATAANRRCDAVWSSCAAPGVRPLAAVASAGTRSAYTSAPPVGTGAAPGPPPTAGSCQYCGIGAHRPPLPSSLRPGISSPNQNL